MAAIGSKRCAGRLSGKNAGFQEIAPLKHVRLPRHWWGRWAFSNSSRRHFVRRLQGPAPSDRCASTRSASLICTSGPNRSNGSSELYTGARLKIARGKQPSPRLAAGAGIASSPALRESILAMTDFPSPLVRFPTGPGDGRSRGAESGVARQTGRPRMRRSGDLRGHRWQSGNVGRRLSGRTRPCAIRVACQPRRRSDAVLREAAVAVVEHGNSDQLRATFLFISPEKAESVTPGDLAILAGLARASRLGDTPCGR